MNIFDFDKTIYFILISSFIICVVVMFSTEIKRSVWNTKTTKRVSIETANKNGMSMLFTGMRHFKH